MNLLEMAAAIAGCNEAMRLEGLSEESRDKILARFTDTLTRCALAADEAQKLVRSRRSTLAPLDREDRDLVDAETWQEQAARDAGVPRSGPI